MTKKSQILKSSKQRLGPYDLIQTLGEGKFGKVKLGIDSNTGEKVAIKIIKKEEASSDSHLNKVEKEISTLKQLKHPNIVEFYKTLETEKYIGIVLQYASGGELFEYISRHRYLKEKEAKILFAQLISSIKYMHSCKIVHRDLKLENILLDENRNIIVTDFGFANQFSTTANDMMSTTCGSPCYAAPELVVNAGLYAGSAVDIWSCGVILFAMISGFLPFDDDPSNPDSGDINRLYRYILSATLKFPSHISIQARDLLEKILVPDPSKRCTLDFIANHVWLEDVDLLDHKIGRSHSISKPRISKNESLFTPITATTFVPNHNIQCIKCDNSNTEHNINFEEKFLAINRSLKCTKLKKNIPFSKPAAGKEIVSTISRPSLLSPYFAKENPAHKSIFFRLAEKKEKKSVNISEFIKTGSTCSSTSFNSRKNTLFEEQDQVYSRSLTLSNISKNQPEHTLSSRFAILAVRKSVCQTKRTPHIEQDKQPHVLFTKPQKETVDPGSKNKGKMVFDWIKKKPKIIKEQPIKMPKKAKDLSNNALDHYNVETHIQIHQGPIDCSALTSRPPQKIIKEVTHVLYILGIDTYTNEQDGPFILNCTRRKISKQKESGSQPIYGEPTIDNGKEIRFVVKICRFKGLPGLFIVDVKRIKGNMCTYMFLYHKLIDLLGLSKDKCL